MIVTLSNKNFEININSKGAELISFKNKNTLQNYIWEGNPKFWAKHSPILFPIVGTLKNDTYIYDKKKYKLSRHGFARDCDFEIVNASENEVSLVLKSNSETIKIYPFEFELQLNYIIENSNLKLNYKITNNSKTEMPFSIGAHPAFALNNNFEDYSLEFEHQEILKSFTLENGLLSENFFEINLENKKLPLTYSLFENDALIFKTIKSKKITILEQQKPLLSVSYSDFENLGLWTISNAPFLCIEPWLGYSDTNLHNQQILEKEGIKIVKENDTFECNLEISIL